MDKKYKKNLILDLDETLISAVSDEEYNPKKHDKKKMKFRFKHMDSYYIVFYRPGLDKFLRYIFKNFNISVFTAASKDYALFIIENIILEEKDRELDYIFFSYHCDITKKIKNGIKDLSILWDVYKLDGYNKYNTIIIDDNPDVKKTGYCLQIPEFNFLDKGSHKDNYLDKLIDILEEYKNFPNDQQFAG